jgi:hypothetical protein
MLPNLLGGLFRKHCPQCKAEIQRGGEGVLRRLGKLFCSQSHADTYECSLYQALDEFQCRHAARHGVYVPLLMASTMDCDASGASVESPGTARCGLLAVFARTYGASNGQATDFCGR